MFGRQGLVVLALSALWFAGCDDDKKDTAASDAGVDGGPKGPVLGGRLGEAVAAASASAPKPGAAGNAAVAGGPPESGVFAAGAADAILARGGSSKLEVFSDGADPKVTLVPKIDGAGETKTKVTVAVRTGAQSALPTVEFDLSVKVDKPKEPKDSEKKSEAVEPRVGVVAKVTKATLAPVQPGQLPKELSAEIAKLKGSTVRWKVARADGGVGEWQAQLAKEADPGLETALAALADSLACVSVPAPAKPVGVGAYWMVTDRASSAGVDALRYRVVKIEKIDKDLVTLSIELRQYAADEKVSLAGAPKNVELRVEALESQGKGRAELVPGALLATDGEMSQRLSARLKAGQGPQRSMVQIEMSSRLGVDGGE